MGTGNIKSFEFYVPPYTGWLYDANGNRVNLYNSLTSGILTSKISNEDGVIGTQNPIQTNAGSLFASNIDQNNSDIGTFTGSITDLVDSLDSTVSDTTSTNPKYFEIKLKRPIENSSVDFNSPLGSNFSNVKITLKDRSGTDLYVLDDTANDTDYPSREYEWPLTLWCTMRVEFHTTDAVSINWALIEKSEPTHTHSKHLDFKNSTTTPLEADEVWTGEWTSTKNFVQAIIDVVTDEDSATNGLVIELSHDGVTADHSHSYSILDNATDGHHYPSETELLYYRVKYTNGSQAQTVFKLYSTLFSTMVEEGHAHGLDYLLKVDHPAPIVRAIQTGFKPNGESVNAGYTTGGNPKASIEELDDIVRQDLSLYVAGTGDSGSVTLTAANTAYAVPAAAPTGSYRLNIYNGSDTEIFVNYENSNANGMSLQSGERVEDDLGADQQLYAYCASSGKALTYTLKEVV